MNKIFKMFNFFLLGFFISSIFFTKIAYADSGVFSVEINPDNGDSSNNIYLNYNNETLNVYSKLEDEKQNYANITTIGTDIPIRKGYSFEGYYLPNYSEPFVLEDGTFNEEAISNYLTENDNVPKKLNLKAKWSRLKFHINLVSNQKIFRKIYFSNLKDDVIYNSDSVRIYQIDVPICNDENYEFEGYYINDVKVIDSSGNFVMKPRTDGVEGKIALIKKAIVSEKEATLKVKWKKIEDDEELDDEEDSINEAIDNDEVSSEDYSDESSIPSEETGETENDEITSDESTNSSDEVEETENNIVDDDEINTISNAEESSGEEMNDDSSDLDKNYYEENVEMVYEDENGNEETEIIDNEEEITEEIEEANMLSDDTENNESTEDDETIIDNEETNEISNELSENELDDEESEDIESEDEDPFEEETEYDEEDSYEEDLDEESLDEEDSGEEDLDEESLDEEDSSEEDLDEEFLDEEDSGEEDLDEEFLDEEDSEEEKNNTEKYVLCYLKDNNVAVNETKTFKYTLGEDYKGYSISIKPVNSKQSKVKFENLKITGKKVGIINVNVYGTKSGKKVKLDKCSILIHSSPATKTEQALINQDATKQEIKKQSVSIDFNKLKGLNSKKAKKIKCQTKSIKVGNTEKLKYSITPSTANQNVTLKSKNNKILKVINGKKIKGIKTGTAKLVLTSKSNKKLKTTCSIKVKNNTSKPKKTTANSKKQTISSIKMEKKVSIKAKKKHKITYTITPKTAKKSITWTSKNNKIAKVNGNGKVTAVKKGTTNVVANILDKSGKKYKKTIKIIVK